MLVERGDLNDEFSRMVAWVKNRIARLRESLDRESINEDLRQDSLFPEVETLPETLAGEDIDEDVF